MKAIRLIAILTTAALFSSCSQQGKINTLTRKEKADGWILLFDGRTTDGWHNWNEDGISGWIVEDSSLVGQGLGGDIGGDIVSDGEYENFHLKWDWKLGAHGNSGVMYHVVEDPRYNAAYETGPEYQMIEDDDFRDENGDPYPIEEWQKTAADYAMYLPNDQKQVNVRGWNSSEIIFTPERAEYWLNGKKVTEFVPWSEDWYEKRNSGNGTITPITDLPEREGSACRTTAAKFGSGTSRSRSCSRKGHSSGNHPIPPPRDRPRGFPGKENQATGHWVSVHTRRWHCSSHRPAHTGAYQWIRPVNSRTLSAGW